MLNSVQNFLFLCELKILKERPLFWGPDFHLFVWILEIIKALQLAYKAKTTHTPGLSCRVSLLFLSSWGPWNALSHQHKFPHYCSQAYELKIFKGEMLHQVEFIKWFHRILYSYNRDLIIDTQYSQHLYHNQFTHMHTGRGRSVSVCVKVPIQISPWVQGDTSDPLVFLHRHVLHLEENVCWGYQPRPCHQQGAAERAGVVSLGGKEAHFLQFPERRV